jgi:hypothetical protein
MRTLAGFAICLVFLGSGCGGTGDGATLYSVKGKVTADGKPLANCTVNFTTDHPAQGAQPGYSGTTNAAGEYQLSYSGKSGAAAGKYKVSFATVVTQEAAKMAMMQPGSGGPPAPPPAPFPAEYSSAKTSPKEVEVKPTSNNIDISI